MLFLKTFPHPLTASEERYYMQKYTEGDLEAKHILIERNLRLVAHIVKKYPLKLKFLVLMVSPPFGVIVVLPSLILV